MLYICNRREKEREREVEEMGKKMDLDSKWSFSCIVFGETLSYGK